MQDWIFALNRASGILAGLFIGAAVGMMVLPVLIPFETVQHLASVVGLRVEHWGVLWLLTTLGGAVGLMGGLAADAIRKPRAMAQRVSSVASGLQESMGRNFPGLLISLRNTPHQWLGGVRITVAQATIARASTSFDSTPSSSTQTVAYYEVPGANFPHFRLAPKGLLLKLAGAMGLPNLHFADQPEFEDKYLVLATEPLGAQALLDRQVREWLLAHPDVHLESGGTGMLVYRRGKVLDAPEMETFAREAAELLRLADQRRQLMENRPSKPSETDELRAFAAQMPRSVGRAMDKHLQAQLVTRQQVQEFLRQAPPRKIPSNLARPFHDAWGIVAIGAAFVFGSAFFIGAMRVTRLDWGGIVFLSLFMVGGFLMVFFAGRSAARQRRLLRWGELAEAKIENVEATGVEDESGMIFRLSARFEAAGQAHIGLGKVKGRVGRHAENLADEGKTATILYEPSHPERILLVDALVNPPDC